MPPFLVTPRLRRRIRQQVLLERLLDAHDQPMLQQPAGEVRTRQDLAVSISEDILHLNPEATKILKDPRIATVAAVKHTPQERLQLRILRINAQSQQMKLVKAFSRLNAQLDARDARPLPDAIAVVVIRQRNRRKTPRFLGQLGGTASPVARRRMDVKVDYHLKPLKPSETRSSDRGTRGTASTRQHSRDRARDVPTAPAEVPPRRQGRTCWPSRSR